MKKNISIILAILLIIVLCSCGASFDEPAPSDGRETSETVNAVLPNENITSTSNESDKPTTDAPKYTPTIEQPNEIELMTYAQTVLEDYYPNCEYSHNKADYKIVKTDLRYKIEGEISVSKAAMPTPFYLIIQFTNEEYDTYDLISLQLDDEIIYDDNSMPDLTPNSGNDNDILNEKNTQIYNEVMDILSSDFDKSEDEILEEIAPQYDMTSSELKEFLNNYMEAYYQ